MTGLHLVGKINNRHIIYILLVFVKVKSGNSYLVIDLLFLGCSPRTQSRVFLHRFFLLCLQSTSCQRAGLVIIYSAWVVKIILTLIQKHHILIVLKPNCRFRALSVTYFKHVWKLKLSISEAMLSAIAISARRIFFLFYPLSPLCCVIIWVSIAWFSWGSWAYKYRQIWYGEE